MQKIYLLLRNNRQSGPFTREELLQQGLKKHDLVWVEGRSAGWRNPDEIAELKTEQDAVPPTPRTTTQATPNPPAAAAAHSQHIYISLPSRMSQQVESVTPDQPVAAAVNEEEKQESFEDRVLRMQQKVAAYNNRSTTPENKEEPQTKYARSLDEIKEEYAGWLHRQKKRKTGLPHKPVLTGAAALLAIALVSFFIFRKDDAARPASLPQPSLQVASLQVAAGNTAEEKLPARTRKAGLQQTVVKTPTASPKKSPAVKNGKLRTAASKNSATDPVTAKKEPETDAPAVPLSRLIRIFGNDVKKERKGIGDFQLTVQNNSRQALKVVAVDVFYYGSNGRQLQKKTLYFSSLGPHRSLSLTAPGHKKATAVQYKLGLVSSDQGLYYAKQ